MFSVKNRRKPEGNLREINVFGQKTENTTGKSMFAVKNPSKPKENQCIRSQTKENLRKINVFGQKSKKT